MPGSNSRPNVSEGYEVPTELSGHVESAGVLCTFDYLWGCYWLHCIFRFFFKIHCSVVVVEVVSHSWECSKKFLGPLPSRILLVKMFQEV